MVSLICLVIGNMIGTSLYVSSSYALNALGDARIVLLLWAIGGVHAISGAIAYAALAKRLPVSGGEYTYLTRSIDPSIGFVAGWISLVAGFTAPIAAAALLLGSYVSNSFDMPTETPTVATVAIFFAATAYAIHLRVGAWFNNALVAFKFGCFAIFCTVGIPYLFYHGHSGISPKLLEQMGGNPDRVGFGLFEQITAPGMLSLMIGQLFFIVLAYTGFNASIYIVGQIDGPTSDAGSDSRPASRSMIVGKSMVMACIGVTAIYLVLNWIFLYGLEPEKIIASEDKFVLDVAMNIGGETLRRLMLIAIVLSAATSIMAMLATGPRVYAQMAEDGRLPQFFATADDVPVWAIAAQAGLSMTLVWLARLKEILEYLGLTLTACGALTVCTLWFGRKQMGGQSPLRWYEQIAAGLYVAGAVLMLWTARTVRYEQFLACAATFLSGLTVYFIATWMRRKATTK